jgi:hypothetical protein
MAIEFSSKVNDIIDKKLKAMDVADAKFLTGFEPIEKKIYDAVRKKVLDMNFESGKSLFDDENVQIINELNDVISNAIASSGYTAKVNEYLRSFETIKEFNFDAHRDVNDLPTDEMEELINPVQKQVTQQTIDGLTGSGIDTQFIQPMKEGIFKNIVSGATITDLETYLKGYILSDELRLGQFKKYTTQIARDTLNQFDGQVNSRIANEFGLNAFKYVGSLIEDSRPQCVRWVGKGTLLLDELQTEINWANSNGSGMIPGTTPDNFSIYRGGYNCRHSAIPFKMTKSQIEKYNREQNIETPVEAKIEKQIEEQIAELKKETPIEETLKKIRERNAQTDSISDSLFYSKQDSDVNEQMNEVIFNNDGCIEIINKTGTRVCLRTPSESSRIIGDKMKSIDGTPVPKFSSNDSISPSSNGNCATDNSVLNVKIKKGEKILFEKIDMEINDEIINQMKSNGGREVTFKNGTKGIAFDTNVVAEQKKDGWKFWSVRASSNSKGNKNISPTITHESSHIIQNNYDSRLLKIKNLRSKKGLNLNDSPTLYGETNDYEFWAESFTYYVYDNDGLKKRFPKIHSFVEEYLKEFNIDLDTIKIAE